MYNKSIIKNYELDMDILYSSTTINSNDNFMKKNIKTNESNAIYWGNQQNLGYPTQKWDIERRIENDWNY